MAVSCVGVVETCWCLPACLQVSDFNLSRIVEDSLVASSVAASNPRWLAPEVLTGKGATFASVRLPSQLAT